MKKKVRFIINPISGVNKKKKIVELIKAELDTSLFDYEIAYTKAPRHAVELSQQAAQEQYDIVVAVGGDGSVNEVGSGLLGSATAMGIIPTGSGNGLARHLNISTDIKKAIHVLNSGKTVSMDTVSVNEESYVGVAGVGFDAHIAHAFAGYGKRGFSSYLKLVWREYPQYQIKSYDLLIDGAVNMKKDALLICVANSSQFGNNAVIAPAADVQDGMMEVCILKHVPFTSLIPLIIRLFNKSIHQSVFLETIRCRSVSILNNTGGLVHLDGEPKKMGEKLEFKIRPSSLNVVVPQA